MKASEGWGETFVVACQTTEACDPGKGAFDHPASGQQDKAAFGFRQLDHDQANAFPLGLRGGRGD